MKITLKDATFELPDKITVYQSLEWWSLFGDAIIDRQKRIIKLWQAIIDLELISKWESEVLPDHKTDLNEIDDPAVAGLIMDAVNRVYKYLEDKKSVEKK